MKKNLIPGFMIILMLAVFTFGAISVAAREEEPDPYDLSIYMGKSIYEAQLNFPGAKPVPARGFSLFMELGELNKEGMVEAGMSAYSDSGIVRAVQVNASDDAYNILGIHCGMSLADAMHLLLEQQYTLKSSVKNPDGSYQDEYSSYMDVYTLQLTTDAETNVTNLFLMKSL